MTAAEANEKITLHIKYKNGEMKMCLLNMFPCCLNERYKGDFARGTGTQTSKQYINRLLALIKLDSKTKKENLKKIKEFLQSEIEKEKQKTTDSLLYNKHCVRKYIYLKAVYNYFNKCYSEKRRG